MRAVEIVERPDETSRACVVELVDAVAARTGERPVSDQTWIALTGEAEGEQVQLLVVGRSTTSADQRPVTIGAAVIVPSNAGAMLELVLAAGDQPDVAADLAETALDTWARRHGGFVTWWVDDADRFATVAAAAGLSPTRGLHEMRRPLPMPERSSLISRPFVPGVDDAAWLAVNNRAFAGHAEQGGWVAEQLHARFDEPWFDADGFRLVDDPERPGSLIAFCWTKVHGDHDPPLGEIYVIGVDPAHHGQGLGRQATLAGLDWLTDAGLPWASLYVDAGNAAAVHLYRRLGFDVHRTRTAFTGTLASAAGATAAAPTSDRSTR